MLRSVRIQAASVFRCSPSFSSLCVLVLMAASPLLRSTADAQRLLIDDSKTSAVLRQSDIESFKAKHWIKGAVNLEILELPTNSSCFPTEDSSSLCLSNMQPVQLYTADAVHYVNGAKLQSPPPPTVYKKTKSDGGVVLAGFTSDGAMFAVSERLGNGKTRLIQNVQGNYYARIKSEDYDEKLMQETLRFDDAAGGERPGKLAAGGSLLNRHRTLQTTGRYLQIDMEIDTDSTFCSAVAANNPTTAMQRRDFMFAYAQDRFRQLGVQLYMAVSNVYCSAAADPFNAIVAPSTQFCDSTVPTDVLYQFRTYMRNRGSTKTLSHLIFSKDLGRYAVLGHFLRSSVLLQL
jgi:hypothetical protein